jgi:hypothetical protein
VLGGLLCNLGWQGGVVLLTTAVNSMCVTSVHCGQEAGACPVCYTAEKEQAAQGLGGEGRIERIRSPGVGGGDRKAARGQGARHAG